MLAARTLDDVSTALYAHLAQEAGAGFPRLSRCPSSDTVRFLDYFALLDANERDSLLSAVARLRAGGFFLHRPGVMDRVRELAMTDRHIARLNEAMLSARYRMGMRHNGLRMTKAESSDPASIAMRAETRATLDFTPRDDLPPLLVPTSDIALINPAKAPLLRPMIDAAFNEMFATEKKKMPGGEAMHTGIFEGTPVGVGVDYATRAYQIRYSVHIPDETKSLYARGLTYEGLWAAGTGGWNYLTEENAQRSVALLCECVASLVQLRTEVYALVN